MQTFTFELRLGLNLRDIRKRNRRLELPHQIFNLENLRTKAHSKTLIHHHLIPLGSYGSLKEKT
jgi:hypothetical protein